MKKWVCIQREGKEWFVHMVVTLTFKKPTEEEMKVCFGFLSMLNTAIANYKAIALRTRLVTSSTVRL